MNYRKPSTRRAFLQQTAAGILAAGAAPNCFASSSGEIPIRPLGKTGENVSILGVGGYHVGAIRDDSEAIRLVQEAVDMGVTFMDNAWEYHQGHSEEIMGKALKGRREKAFLMTKHHGRDKKTAMKHLEDSLRRLQTDTIDLWQFHEIVYEKDPEMIFAKGGGIEAAIEAKKSGKARFIGFTGHKDPKYLLKMLSYDFDWDVVQMPLSVLDAHFRSFEQTILPVCLERRIGVLGMKSLASGNVLLTETVTADEALRYALSLPVSTVISGMNSLKLLRANAETARTLQPMTMAQRTALLERTKDAAKDGKYEPFKTTNQFDGPIGRKLHGIE